jgi:hypothetical protein
MPFTRFIHGNCHSANAFLPNTAANYPDANSIQFHNGVLSCYNYPACGGCSSGYKDGCQTATALCTFENALYPFQHTLQIPASGGHHDAGDYSKYIANVAGLIHTLTFAVDNFPGAANLTSLGIPESGKITPNGPVAADLLEEAKWEADFLLKMQDTDGGFYFLVYPTGRSEYESWTPDRNKGQLLYPKNTGSTAAAVAALAEIASSPAFKARYPTEAGTYMTAAVSGWNFLNTALANHGTGQWPYAGAYQTVIPSFGGYYMHQDYLLWAAAAMFSAGQIASQNGVIVDPHTRFLSWLGASSSGVSAQNWSYGYGQTSCGSASLDSYGMPSDFGPLLQGFGCAFRDYAFAIRSQRLSGGLNSGALKLCENEILSAGENWRAFSANTSYGVCLDNSLKASFNTEFYFATDIAFGLAVNDRLVSTLTPSDPAYVTGHNYAQDHVNNVQAILENFNYQHGCNPLNLMFVTGNGWKRERQIVHQYANFPNYDARLLPPSGVPYGNISFGSSGYLSTTGPVQGCDIDGYYYPRSGDCPSCPNHCPGSPSTVFELYDRWGDYHNVIREFSTFRTANALCAAAYVHGLSGAVSPAWQHSDGYFTFLSGTPAMNVPTVVRLDTTDPSANLDEALITWDPEFEDQPSVGRTVTLKPRVTPGDTLIEAEAVLPDGRRIFGRQYAHFKPTNGGQEFPLPDANTVALFHFNDGSQLPTFVDSANGYNLAQSSGFPDLLENNSWMANGNSASKAARFAGIDDQISSSVMIPYASLPGGSSGLTIEFRLYVKRLPNDGSALTLFRFAGAPPGNSSSEWSIRYRTDFAPYPYFQVPNDHVVPNDNLALSSGVWSAKMTPNTWHAVKITATAGGLTSVYIDDMTTAAASGTNPVNWSITNWQLSIGSFIGCLDELRISKGLR